MNQEDAKTWRRLETIEAEAAAAGFVVPVSGDAGDRRLWRACDLASLVEGCFGERVEPEALDEAGAKPWIDRLGGTFAVAPLDTFRDPVEPEGREWLLADGRRVGTIALSVSRFRGPWLFVHSLFVWPRERGHGVAGRALDALAEIAARHGLAGVRLATSWTWQKSLRFYLERGFWVYMWKHDIQLVMQPALPKRRFSIDGDVAHFDVVEPSLLRRLFTARRAGEELQLEEAELGDSELGHVAHGTFALLLALAGWPLVRSEGQWAQRYSWSDMGEVEGLAYKIGVFERVARERGWSLNTVAIPGLDRWQAWARGEEYGSDAQLQRDIEAVVSARGWQLNAESRDRIRGLDHYLAHDLLRSAVTAPTLEAWLATMAPTTP
jgi:GNAT superfamily N-acetyltransferase